MVGGFGRVRWDEEVKINGFELDMVNWRCFVDTQDEMSRKSINVQI